MAQCWTTDWDATNSPATDAYSSRSFEPWRAHWRWPSTSPPTGLVSWHSKWAYAYHIASQIARKSRGAWRTTAAWHIPSRATTTWPATTRPATARPTTARSATARPTATRPAATRPAAARPTTARSAAAAARPAASTRWCRWCPRSRRRPRHWQRRG